jgi:hypothetical protein
VSERERVPDVSEGDLHVDPVLPELPWIPDQGADPVAPSEQLRQELSADDAGCSRDEDHAVTLASAVGRPLSPRLA